jgi:hypothetical protein
VGRRVLPHAFARKPASGHIGLNAHTTMRRTSTATVQAVNATPALAAMCWRLQMCSSLLTTLVFRFLTLSRYQGCKNFTLFKSS